MHVHLDPLGGIAGDMFIAAALDAWPEWQPDLFAALALALPQGWQPALVERRQHSIVGRHFSLSGPGAAHHDSGAFHVIRERLAGSSLEGTVRRHAIGIFTLLAEAESAIHGVPVDDVHFHELADWDSIADIVAAAWLIARIDARSWSVGPLPLGGGTVRTAHGLLPVPAPATVRLLEGLACIDDGHGGERVTPTGAAILRYLDTKSRSGLRGRLQRSGYGLGTRELPDRANLLRLLALDTSDEASDSPARADEVLVLEFAIDDQSSEDLAVALDHLRGLPEVLDVSQTVAVGKKGRLVHDVQVLCTPASLPQVSRRCFEETTTIGLRWRLEHRLVLPRTQVIREGLRIKRVERPGGATTAKAEIDDVHDRRTHSERTSLRRRAEAEEDEHE